MKDLVIKKNDFGLRVYCTKCKRQYYHNNIGICGHPNHQHYKSIVSDGLKRRAKMYDSKSYNEALKLAIEFKQAVKNGSLNNDSYNGDLVNISILEAAQRFVKFKSGDEVPTHLRKDITPDHFKDIKRNIQQFIDILRDYRIEVNAQPIESLNDNHVGYWYDYVVANYSKRSLPTKLKIMRSFIEHVIEYMEVTMRNPFKRVVLDDIDYQPKSVSAQEFKSVIEAIDTSSPFHQLAGKRKERKNVYRPYLKNGFKLAILTGLRREEVVSLTWKDIHKDPEQEELVIIIDNLKVERITGRKYKPKFIVITEELMEHLVQMGYYKFKTTDNYILEPHRKVKPLTMMNNLSKAFTHYYKMAFPNSQPKQFKHLRKTYISHLKKEVGDKVYELTSHSGMGILNKHYIDESIVSKAAKMRILA